MHLTHTDYEHIWGETQKALQYLFIMKDKQTSTENSNRDLNKTKKSKKKELSGVGAAAAAAAIYAHKMCTDYSICCTLECANGSCVY